MPVKGKEKESVSHVPSSKTVLIAQVLTDATPCGWIGSSTSTPKMKELEDIIARALTEAFKKLLSEKHLYQSIEVDLGDIPKAAEGLRHKFIKPLRSNMREAGPFMPSAGEVSKLGVQLATRFWMAVARPSNGKDSDTLEFALPTINTFCSNCEASWPFNPNFNSQMSVRGADQQQWFYLGYDCQQCKEVPVRFLVRREGSKIRLTGRDPLEVLPTPRVLPKSVAKYYSDAMVAHHAGQTLAGLFFLRVFVEQYWRTNPAVKELLKTESRPTGESQGDAYQKALPTDFKERFPSLKEIYGRLSEALHAADANATIFGEAAKDIVYHFEARDLFKLK